MKNYRLITKSHTIVKILVHNIHITLFLLFAFNLLFYGVGQLVKKSTRHMWQIDCVVEALVLGLGVMLVVVTATNLRVQYSLSLLLFRDLSVTSWPCDELTVFP